MTENVDKINMLQAKVRSFELAIDKAKKEGLFEEAHKLEQLVAPAIVILREAQSTPEYRAAHPQSCDLLDILIKRGIPQRNGTVMKLGEVVSRRAARYGFSDRHKAILAASKNVLQENGIKNPTPIDIERAAAEGWNARVAYVQAKIEAQAAAKLEFKDVPERWGEKTENFVLTEEDYELLEMMMSDDSED